MSTESSVTSSSSPNRITLNPRGIPQAVFLDNVEDFIAGGDSDSSLKTLQETLAKYRFMESNSLSRRAGLEEKIPELERTIGMVELLLAKEAAQEPFLTTFELSDTLYVKAEVDAEDLSQVYIWLGAGVMLSYPLLSAHTLLSNKLTTARQNYKNVKEDLGYLRDQVTVMEVNLARVYNWDVARRRREREEGEGK